MSPIEREPEQPQRRRKKTMSARQRAANRENAKKGGPRTAKGRERSSANSTRHGGWAKRLAPIQAGVLREDPKDFEAYVGGIIDGLDPRDFLEEEQAKVIALAYVRLGRVERLETKLLERAGELSDPGGLLNAARRDRIRRSEEADQPAATNQDPVRKPPRGAATSWLGDEEDLTRLFYAVRCTLDCIREPDLFEPDAPIVNWQHMAGLLRHRHPDGAAVDLRGVWDGDHWPITPEQWRQAFETLRTGIWATDEEATEWLMWFLRDELAEFGRITGRALSDAANRATDEIERVARVRSAATRDLIVHLNTYGVLQRRDIVSKAPPRETNP